MATGVTIINARLTDKIEAGAVCYSSRWQNSRQIGVNGLPHHNAVWSRPIGRFDIGSGMQSLSWVDAGEVLSAIDNIITMHFVTRGGRDGFLFRDPADFYAEDEVIGTGDGSTTTFQLTKTYTNAGGSYVRTVKRPIAGTLTVSVNGVVVGESGGWSLNTTTGVLTFDTAPGNGLAVEATFQFLKAVAFERDDLGVEVQRIDVDDISQSLMAVPAMPLIEIPEA